MRYLIWLLRAVIFVLLLGFAVKNDQPVTLRYFFGFEWNTSLVIILLVFFVLGVAVGLLALSLNFLRQRRELSALKRELRMKNRLTESDDAQPLQPS